MSNVTLIPPKPKWEEALALGLAGKKRVAAYARVSTDNEEQLNSYEAQVSYYTQYIQSKPEWEFAGVYPDKGITGTSTKKREKFNEMIRDALDGKIDLIITKSVSRFARNTVDSLQTIRMLKEHGVEVYFEEQNIYTMDSKGELLITIMSSLAQEESRSISENVTWGQRKRFADGKVSMPYKRFLGYRRGENGKPEIVEEEAAVVRDIYRWFMQGMSPSAIAKRLMQLGIPSPAGHKTWRATTVRSILTNEKYKGDALLQKTYVVDFLTKTIKVNDGDVAQYYVQGSHPAIIAPEEFDAVQVELARREEEGGRTFSNSPFSMKLVCGECGGTFGPKVWCSNTKYRRTVWRCNEKYRKNSPCNTGHLYEEQIKAAFLKAFNQLMVDRKGLGEICDLMLQELGSCDEMNARIENLQGEVEGAQALIEKTVQERAANLLGYEEFLGQQSVHKARKEEAEKRLGALLIRRRERQVKAQAIRRFNSEILESGMVLTEFDEALWAGIVESVRVMADEALEFHFVNGVNVMVR